MDDRAAEDDDQVGDGGQAGEAKIDEAEWLEEDQYTVDDDAAFDEVWT